MLHLHHRLINAGGGTLHSEVQPFSHAKFIVMQEKPIKDFKVSYGALMVVCFKD